MTASANDRTMTIALPAEGYVRLKHIIGYVDREAGMVVVGPVPISKSQWWAGVRCGKYPKPVMKDGARCTYWDVRDIRKLLPGEKRSEG